MTLLGNVAEQAAARVHNSAIVLHATEFRVQSRQCHLSVQKSQVEGGVVDEQLNADDIIQTLVLNASKHWFVFEEGVRDAMDLQGCWM